MTLILAESDVTILLDMKDVVEAVEESFRRRAEEKAVNSLRTRTAALQSDAYSEKSADLVV